MTVPPTITATATAKDDYSKDLSTYMLVVVVFVTHGLMNSVLLGFSPVRCAHWNRRECDPDEEWMLNWFAFGHFHVNFLLACLAYTARGQVLLEQRLVCFVTAMMISQLSTGIFLLDYLNKPMAIVQLMVYIGLLVVVVYHTATAPFVVPLPTQLRSSSFDARQSLPVPTVGVALQCIGSSFQLYDMTFGTGRGTYLGDTSGDLFRQISHIAVTQMLWVTLILGGCVLLATVPQQKMLLAGQAVCLFGAVIMMTGPQGSRIETAQARAGCIGSFFSMIMALIGSF